MINFLRDKIIQRKLNSEDKKFIAPHFPGGRVDLKDLRKIVDTCEQFPECKIKLSGELIIGGITDEIRNEEFRRALDIPTTSLVGFSVRAVKLCSGGYLCSNNLQDSSSLGLRLDEMFEGRRLPFKLIIAVSGCPRSCSEPMVRDIGIVAYKNGYAIFVGGAAGAKPRIGVKVCDSLSMDEVINITERIITMYEKNATMGERLGRLIERIGLEKFTSVGAP